MGVGIEIPQEAIRDAVAAVIVTMLGENRDETLRNMIAGVLESKGSFGRSEFDNMVMDAIRERAKLVVKEMLADESIKQMIHDNIQQRLDGMVNQFISKFTEELIRKLERPF